MASQLVRRCWANGTRAGYQYIDIVPAQRRLLPEVPMPPLQAAASPGGFVVFNDFVHISRQLVYSSEEAMDLLYPAEQIHTLLRHYVPPVPEVFGNLF
jgi:hypothetical protein